MGIRRLLNCLEARADCPEYSLHALPLLRKARVVADIALNGVGGGRNYLVFSIYIISVILNEGFNFFFNIF